MVIFSLATGAVFEEAAWTDDTDQSLLILMSFLRSGGKEEIDYQDFAQRLKVKRAALLSRLTQLTLFHTALGSVWI